jgi:hypothetical protein
VGQCPLCETELIFPDEVEWVTCQECGERLDVRAQQAYARAHAAFVEAEEIAAERHLPEPGRGTYRAKARPDSVPLGANQVHAYQQAYFGLRAAFGGALAAEQQLTGVKMLAQITRRLAPRAMASQLEAEYWTRRVFELTAQDELLRIEGQLRTAGERRGLASALRRLSWRSRRRQLRVTLARLRRQTDDLERAIGFLEPPRIDRRP